MTEGLFIEEKYNYKGKVHFRKRPASLIECDFCKKEFLKVNKNIRDNNYCSPICSSNAQKDRVKLDCTMCGKKFKRVKSKLKGSKNGYYFCSRKCKEYAQSFKSDFEGITPSHYNGSRSYSPKAFATYNKCCDCGEDKRYLLFVHHIDSNRDNNNISNLVVLCANCHIKRHLDFKDGGWFYNPYSLTPLDKIKDL